MELIRTNKQFMKEMQEAHDCEKCHGKIFAIRVDMLGNRYCGYCGEKVNYPTPTKEELEMWMKK